MNRQSLIESGVRLCCLCSLLLVGLAACAQDSPKRAAAAADVPNPPKATPPPYSIGDRVATDFSEIFEEKTVHMVPMRDGIKLYTEVYWPKGFDGPLPIMLERTPYYANPGYQDFSPRLKNFTEFFEEGFIIVLQDLRGRLKSEGEHVPLRPQRDPDDPDGIDESTDYYDTIEWIVNNVPNNNGRVGTLGISYGGFLSTRAMLDPHPALRAVSPQATCADLFIGDDFFHNGAFRLSYAFAAAYGLDTWKPARELIDQHDEYEFFLDIGPLKNITEMIGEVSPTWLNYVKHPIHDEQWQYEFCGVLPYMTEVTVPTLNVTGWYDPEDFYGPIEVYKKLEKADDKNENLLVLGPWYHGGWTFKETGRTLGPFDLGSDTARWFRDEIHVKWFTYWLKDKGELPVAEALTFQMGSNEWQTYDQWPPTDGIESRRLYLREEGCLSFEAPEGKDGSAVDTFVSDPAKPVPFRYRPYQYPYGWQQWMLQDQRFVHKRPDVLTWVSEPLDEDLSITGSPIANLFAATTGSDADWVVKLIDVYPDVHESWDLQGYQMIVAAEVFRSRFKSSFTEPEPITPNEINHFQFSLRDRNHRFLKGHRIMVQIQSSWFPLIDRNPQTYVDNIFKAEASDFQKETQSIYRSRTYPTHIELPVNLR